MTADLANGGSAPGHREHSRLSRDLVRMVADLRQIMALGTRVDLPMELLPMAQVEILYRLIERPGARLSDVAARQRLAINTVSALVSELVKKGFVSRSPDPADRRAALLEVTAEGSAALEGWFQLNETLLERGIRELPEHATRNLGNTLPALRELIHVLETQQEQTRDS